MKTIKQIVKINASPSEVYGAFVEAKKHSEFTGANAIFENKIGGKFDIWDGSLTGENLELINAKKIVQKWRGDDWPDGHFSKLTITLVDEKDGAKLTLVQENVPDDKADDVADGWYQYYWKPMNEYFKKKK